MPRRATPCVGRQHATRTSRWACHCWLAAPRCATRPGAPTGPPLARQIQFRQVASQSAFRLVGVDRLQPHGLEPKALHLQLDLSRLAGHGPKVQVPVRHARRERRWPRRWPTTHQAQAARSLRRSPRSSRHSQGGISIPRPTHHSRRRNERHQASPSSTRSHH